MKIKIPLIIAAVLLFAVSAWFAIFAFQREDKDVFIKIALWYYRYEGGHSAHYFVVENDGTFTSYLGNVRNHNDITRRNFLRLVSDREVIILNEQEFQNISEISKHDNGCRK